MTSVSTNYTNPYAGSAYSRAVATQPSLATLLSGQEDSNNSSSAATHLTLSLAARAQLASNPSKDLSAVTSDARSALNKLYTDANVTGPYDVNGKPTIDLTSLDRRTLFAIATNSAAKFTPDEQALAASELKTRFNTALSAATQTAQLTSDYSAAYKAAIDYLDAAGPEERATVAWNMQREAAAKGLQVAQQNPSKAPSGISNDPVAAYLAQYPDGKSTPTQDFSSVAKSVRAKLDAQASLAQKAGKELVFDPGRKTGQLADLSQIDNRSLSAIALNQDQLFSAQESFAAKQELNGRGRASILSALKQSQTSGDPTQLSLGILNAYSAMSSEERQAANWSTALRDNAVQSYKSTSTLLSMLRG